MEIIATGRSAAPGLVRWVRVFLWPHQGVVPIFVAGQGGTGEGKDRSSDEVCIWALGKKMRCNNRGTEQVYLCLVPVRGGATR